MFKIKEGKSFLGKTVVLSTDKMEMEVTVEVGPRIISLKKNGGENIMFLDINDEINKDVSEVYGKNEMWHIYGGHRIWVSPEDLATYYPDNEKVEYSICGNSVIFTNPIKKGNLDRTLEIKYLSENTLDVIMKVKNNGKDEQKLSIWALTVLKCGGKLTIPLEQKDTGLLANRNFVYWSYSDYNDPRVAIDNEKLTMLSNPNVDKAFKLGFYKEEIKATYEILNTIFTKEITAEKDAEYPDYNCNLETYTNKLIHEVETLGAFKSLSAGQESIHTEKWTIS